jgi:hypothetical protein
MFTGTKHVTVGNTKPEFFSSVGMADSLRPTHGYVVSCWNRPWVLLPSETHLIGSIAAPETQPMERFAGYHLLCPQVLKLGVA